MATISENSVVFICSGAQNYVRPQKVVAGGKCQIGRHNFKLDSLVGHGFGQLFAVENNQLTAVDTSQRREGEEEGGAGGEEQEEQEEQDNRAIIDSSSNQLLEPAEIAELSTSGLPAGQLITTIASHNKNFEQKTAFAKEKYLKKKKNKYRLELRVHQPSVRLFWQHYYQQEPGKIQWLRWDAFAQLLHLSNVAAGCKPLVVESCRGLLLAGVLGRLAGTGTVISFFKGDHYPLAAALSDLNVPQQHLQLVRQYPIGLLSHFEDDSDPESAAKKLKLDEENSSDQDGKPAQLDELNDHLNSCDALLMASLFKPVPLVAVLLKFLRPSRPFVVYSAHLEPLVECFDRLPRLANLAVSSVRLTDCFLRDWQVLPGRTRPSLKLNGQSGYLLFGYKVEK